MSKNISFTPEKRDALLRPEMVRQRCLKIFESADRGHTHFNLHLDKLEDTATFVVEVIKKNYPTLKIPIHSRMGHFNVKRDRISEILELFKNETKDQKEIARRFFDLVVVSVLLDAGAGAEWKYVEEETGFILSRSEGLAVAGLHMFLQGDFSHNKSPEATAQGLKSFSDQKLTEGMQVSNTNPLVGLEGRSVLLKTLGATLEKVPEFIGDRPGGLIDYIESHFGKQINGSDLLHLVLKCFGPIWPSRLSLGGINMGDTWVYPPWVSGEKIDTEALIPFHKLSQWLTYSLVSPLLMAGIEVVDLDLLTGLPEYRNGGLFLDSGVISLKDPNWVNGSFVPSDILIIEWRALTVTLLDKIAVEIRNQLGLSPKNFSLGKVLEGGTWSAGREYAAKLRGGRPPFTIISDGTVF